MRRLGARSETSGESTVRSNLVGNAGSRPISEAKQPWACPVLGWGTTGEAHVLYSTSQKNHMMVSGLRSARSGALQHLAVFAAESPVCLPSLSSLLSLPSLDHFSLSLVSTWTCDFGLAVVCLSRCGSIPPRPLLSLSYPSPPPTRVGPPVSSFKLQVSSFKLLGLEYPPVLLSLPAPRSLEYLEPLCWDTLLIASPLPPSPFCVV